MLRKTRRAATGKMVAQMTGIEEPPSQDLHELGTRSFLRLKQMNRAGPGEELKTQSVNLPVHFKYAAGTGVAGSTWIAPRYRRRNPCNIERIVLAGNSSAQYRPEKTSILLKKIDDQPQVAEEPFVNATCVSCSQDKTCLEVMTSALPAAARLAP